MPSSLISGKDSVRVVKPPLPDESKMLLIPLDVLLLAIRQYLTAPTRAEIEAEFGRYLGRPQWPIFEALRFVDYVCTSCLVDLPVSQGRELIGRCYMAHLARTRLAQAVRAVMRLASIEWVLRGLPENIAAVRNYGGYEIRKIAPHHWRLTIEDDPTYPEVMLGLLQEGSDAFHRPPESLLPRKEDAYVRYHLVPADVLRAGVRSTEADPSGRYYGFDITW